MKRIRKMLVWIAALLAIVQILIWIVDPPYFNSASVCSVCGACRIESRRFYIPFQTIQETKLSRLVDEIGIVKGHDHKWQYSSGAGGTVICSIGSRRHLNGLVNNADLLVGLKAIRRNRGNIEAQEWINKLLDVNYARAGLAGGLLAPTEGIETPEGFKTWYENAIEWRNDLDGQ